MAIDNPFDAFRKRHFPDEPDLPNKLEKVAADHGLKAAIPNAWAAGVLIKVIDVLFDEPSRNQRVRELFELISAEFEHVDRIKVSSDYMEKAILRAIWATDLSEMTVSERSMSS